mmetsp:Transcript_26730/g.78749  ORF Transcript_26730/g.78749 Transcript_26730/m.78749 type:complete len:219 (-) Transcript_26730:166-822(-)
MRPRRSPPTRPGQSSRRRSRKPGQSWRACAPSRAPARTSRPSQWTSGRSRRARASSAPRLWSETAPPWPGAWRRRDPRCGSWRSSSGARRIPSRSSAPRLQGSTRRSRGGRRSSRLWARRWTPSALVWTRVGTGGRPGGTGERRRARLRPRPLLAKPLALETRWAPAAGWAPAQGAIRRRVPAARPLRARTAAAASRTRAAARAGSLCRGLRATRVAT